MVEIPYPDRHRVLAAQGWLELKLPQAALEELAGLSKPIARLPIALELEWRAWADQREWQCAWRLAETTVALHPNHIGGWIHRSYAARRAPNGGIQIARELLLPALERFPSEPMIPYNLACYGVQLGNLDEGWAYLRRAASVSSAKEIRSMAESDDDLRPLWPRLREL